MSRILVLGGGVVGLSAALALARAGHAVTVLEPDAARAAASWGNAGHIATEQVAPLASVETLLSAWKRRFAAGGAMDLPLHLAPHWLPFALRFVNASSRDGFQDGCDALRPLLAAALPAWERLAEALGCPELLKRDGHLVAWESEASAAKGRAAWEAADTGTAIVHPASADDLAAIRGVTTASIAGVARFGGTAQIADLGQLAEALEAALTAAGGRILRERGAVGVQGGRACVPGHEADLLLVCAGARSAALVAPAGLTAPLIAERGYHIRADASRWPADMPPLVFEDRSMIVTRYAHAVQAASFVEFGTPDAPPDVRKWERLEAHVAALGLPLSGPFTRWMGARPTLPDYLPAIGRSRAAPNLLYAFGHQHLGLTLAAITSELVAALVAGDASPVPLKPFDLARFGEPR
ncbi:FAD-binding oxidoreductase [Sandaracinobacter neustonicus]|uniref:FAD-binding oxidoreductase n=1 Tax=Sandaracinobacter neustonicus TaxID=1715348 RepID=A0A501XVG8_9SPHN|nr:FAD-binding oxidoreductase [Sandaracinobacter neustonicus]TPE64782.1 FAD-binding oxidoreductase [Sandaracinobacter neustonicus]